MASEESLENKVLDVVAQSLGVHIRDIKCDSDIVNDLGADSLSATELVMGLEEAFNISISNNVLKVDMDMGVGMRGGSSMGKVRTVGQLIDYIRKRCSAKA